MRFRVIDGCPAPASIAPYVYLVLREANMRAESIYRGSDAKKILHRHHKHTQAEIHRMMPTISNPEGESQHDLHSDGNANPGPVGRRLQEFEVGIDAGTNDARSKRRVEAAAHHYGWQVRHPYTRGVEGHHFCFARRPVPHSLRMRLRILHLRATLPRR